MKKLIPEEALASATRLTRDNPIIPLLSRVARIDKVNDLYDEICEVPGVASIDRLFQILQLECHCSQSDLDNIPKEGPFVVVANHPYGAIDGLALIHAFAKARPDFKIMANFLLQNVEPIRDFILAVNPFEERKSAFSNISGLKAAIAHLESGKPLGLFPAGEVSTFQGDLKTIADRKWQNSAMKIVRNAGVPIIPVYFDGGNSYAFHLMGLIHPNLRTLALPSELLNKKGHSFRMRIGKPITQKETSAFSTIDQFGRYLRAKTYALGSSLEIKRDYFRLFRFPVRQAALIPAANQGVIEKEIASIADLRTLSYDNFECYVASSNRIPNILTEIGRLREVTFREVGEGTNKSIDLDEYDLYYNHLILWDAEQKRIAGAYRVGDGRQIMQQYGTKGFYTSSLFRMGKQMRPILSQSIELGRSFIVKDYQKHRLSLFLLWKGILFYLLGNAQFRYIIGPVSISNSYQEVSKELIIQFIRRHYFDEELAQHVEPRNAFRPKIRNVDTDVLIAASQSDLKKMDKIISDIEPSSFTMPVLLKKYLQQNARILAFNSDPQFNNALDGLMLLDLHNLPPDTVETLKREMVAS
ncbi:MAG: lysophospholipid acyltransferase family protein [Flavobacteriales bacterium]